MDAKTDEGVTTADMKRFAVRPYLRQLTPVLAEAFAAMENEECAVAPFPLLRTQRLPSDN